jgi:hypothetical protein
MAPAASNIDVHAVARRIGARLPWEPRRTDAGHVFTNAADSLTAAATVVDLVIEDLGRFAPGDVDVAIADLYEIRTSIRDIAREAAAAAVRAG